MQLPEKPTMADRAFYEDKPTYALLIMLILVPILTPIFLLFDLLRFLGMVLATFATAAVHTWLWLV